MQGDRKTMKTKKQIKKRIERLKKLVKSFQDEKAMIGKGGWQHHNFQVRIERIYQEILALMWVIE